MNIPDREKLDIWETRKHKNFVMVHRKLNTWIWKDTPPHGSGSWRPSVCKPRGWDGAYWAWKHGERYLASNITRCVFPAQYLLSCVSLPISPATCFTPDISRHELPTMCFPHNISLHMFPAEYPPACVSRQISPAMYFLHNITCPCYYITRDRINMFISIRFIWCFVKFWLTTQFQNLYQPSANC